MPSVQAGQIGQAVCGRSSFCGVVHSNFWLYTFIVVWGHASIASRMKQMQKQFMMSFKT